jgi:hypothetical protein
VFRSCYRGYEPGFGWPRGWRKRDSILDEGVTRVSSRLQVRLRLQVTVGAPAQQERQRNGCLDGECTSGMLGR